MRKNLLFTALAATTLLLATSCQQDEVFVDGNEATVTFEVGTPEIATRAFSQGEKATKLQYAVYDAEFNYVDREGLHGTIDFNKQANVPLQLAAGKTYNVLFWADAYGNAQDAPYTVDFAALKMNVNYTGAVCNDESRDAFYNLVEVTVGQANETKEVKLTRPFAQLNIGTNDLDKLDGVSAAKTQVKVNVYNQLDLKTGFVTTGSTATAQTFTLADRPAETEAFPVNGYKYLAMNYLLVGKDKTVVDVEFSYGADAATAKTRTYTGIPVQPNYRTNIYGSLLTQGIDFDVEIEPGYNGNIPGDDMLDKLILASQVGGEITLESDIVTDNVITVAENVELTINLNGKTITGNFSDKDNETIIDNDGTLKIIGGTIKNTAANGASIINNSGSLILDGVTILGAPIADGGYPSYAVYTSGSLVVEEGTVVTSDRGAIHTQSGADVTINGGNFSVTDALGSRTLTAHVIYAYGNGTKLTINDGTFALNYAAAGNTGASVICPAGATIDVYNGNFSYAGTVGQSAVFQNYMGYGAPVNVYGGTYSDESVSKHVADGYKVVESADKYVVVPATVDDIVSNTDELKAAVATATDPALVTIYMKAGTYDTKDFQFMNKTINLKGIEDGVKIFISQNTDVACTSFDMCTISFENLTIETLGGIYKGFARMNGNYKNCTIVNNYFTFYGKHVFESCTFNAPPSNEHCMWTYGATEVDFVNCKFNYSDRGINVYVDNGANAPGITSDVEFTNCEFITENTSSLGAVEVNSSPFTAGVTVTLNNCDAPDYGKMVYVSSWDGTKGKTATITVDGMVVAGLASILENVAAGSTITLAEGADMGTVEVAELKDVTIEGNGSVMIFKTTADTKIENVTLENVKFEYTGATADCGIVIDANAQIDNLVVEGCSFEGTGAKAGRGISGLNNNASIELKECTFKDLGYPIYAWGSYESLIIEGCTFDNIKSWAIMPQSGFDGDLTVTGNTFKNCLGGGLIKAGTLTAGHTFTFTNNTVTGCTVAGDHNWFQFNVSAGTSVISGNTKDGAAWTPTAADGLNN